MADNRHGPPPGLSDEERRPWQQWRRFVWMEGDVVVIREGDGRRPEEDEGNHEGRGVEQPERGE